MIGEETIQFVMDQMKDIKRLDEMAAQMREQEPHLFKMMMMRVQTMVMVDPLLASAEFGGIVLAWKAMINQSEIDKLENCPTCGK